MVAYPSLPSTSVHVTSLHTSARIPTHGVPSLARTMTTGPSARARDKRRGNDAAFVGSPTGSDLLTVFKEPNQELVGGAMDVEAEAGEVCLQTDPDQVVRRPIRRRSDLQRIRAERRDRRRLSSTAPAAPRMASPPPGCLQTTPSLKLAMSMSISPSQKATYSLAHDVLGGGYTTRPEDCLPCSRGSVPTAIATLRIHTNP